MNPMSQFIKCKPGVDNASSYFVTTALAVKAETADANYWGNYFIFTYPFNGRGVDDSGAYTASTGYPVDSTAN